MFDAYDELLTAEEACEALKIGRNAIYSLLISGELKGYRVGRGRTWRIPRQALTEYVCRRARLK